MRLTMLAFAYALLFVFVGPAGGQPPAPPAKPAVKLPATMKYVEGQRIEIKLETALKKATWDKFPAGFTADVLDGGLRLLAWAPPGQYPLRANVVNAAGDVEYDASLLEITPLIPPPPPAPPDKLKADLVGLAAGQDKGQVKILASLYRQAVGFCRDKNLTTTGQVIAAIGKAGDALLLTPQTLRVVRDRVLAELHAANLPAADVPLTDDLRDKAADIYGRSGQALEDAAK